VTIRVVLPYHLRNLAKTGPDEIPLEVEPAAGAGAPVTLRDVLDALEARYPVLRGTIRDHATKARRPFLRFYACQEDLSNESPDTPLPKAVVSGEEPLLVVGAMAGG
jgi:sulfur-carrier protein